MANKSITDVQAEAYGLANPGVVFNPDAAITKEWLALKAQGVFIGVPIGPEAELGDADGQPRTAQPFTSGAVLVWYGGADVRVQ